MQTLANTAEAAEGSFTNALATVGATVTPQLKELLNWAGDLAARFGEWARANPVLVGTLVKIVAVAAGLAAAFGALALTFASVVGPMALTRFMFAQIGVALPSVTSLFGLLARAVGGVGSAVVAVGRALLANPLMLALTGIAVAAYLIYQYWEPIKAFFVQLWDSLKQAFSGGLASVGALLADWSPVGLLYRAISAGLSALGVEMPAKFSAFGSMLIQGLVNGITSMGGAVKDTITNLGGGMVDWFKEKLGIRSPSRVFMAQGEFVSQGAAAGIRNAQPAAIRAAQALAASVAIGWCPGPGFARPGRFWRAWRRHCRARAWGVRYPAGPAACPVPPGHRPGRHHPNHHFARRRHVGRRHRARGRGRIAQARPRESRPRAVRLPR